MLPDVYFHGQFFINILLHPLHMHRFGVMDTPCQISLLRFYLLSHLAKHCHYVRIYVGVTKTGSGSPFAKMSTF